MMDEPEVIRALETANARSIAYQSSSEFALGARRKTIERLLSDLSPAGLRQMMHEVQVNIRVSRAPGHEQGPNLSPEEWEASLVPGDPAKRVVVYSCIAGGYDVPAPPLYRAEHIRYILFTDNPDLSGADGWEPRPLPAEVEQLWAHTWASRYLKSHPHDLFAEDFDASIYVDGNVQPVSDLSYYADHIDPRVGFGMHLHRTRDSIADEAATCKAFGKGDARTMELEVSHYVSEGYPLDWGLLETNVVATDLHSDTARKLLLEWWTAMERARSGRDQLSLPYVLWRRGIPCEAVATMGRNVYADTKVFVSGHL